MTRSKAMRCVGDKELGELEKDGVSSCSLVDKRLNLMNYVAYVMQMGAYIVM